MTNDTRPYSNVLADDTDYVEMSKTATARANLAEWRIRALKATSQGLTHLKSSYVGNADGLTEIQAICDLFYPFFEARIDRLQSLVEIERQNARHALDMHNAKGE